MTAFATTDGRRWTVAVNLGTVKRVREATGVDILALVSDQRAISEAFSDNIRLAEVIASVIKPELAAAGVTDDQFFSVIDGAVIESATEALLAEVANFFQEPRRTILIKAMEKVRVAVKEQNARGAAEALKALETMEVEIPSELTHTSSVSSLQESAA